MHDRAHVSAYHGLRMDESFSRCLRATSHVCFVWPQKLCTPGLQATWHFVISCFAPEESCTYDHCVCCISCYISCLDLVLCQREFIQANRAYVLLEICAKYEIFSHLQTTACNFSILMKIPVSAHNCSSLFLVLQLTCLINRLLLLLPLCSIPTLPPAMCR